MRLWLVRHGETISNRDGRFQGHLDIELSQVGERQAARVAEKLKGVDFDGVYASDLQRAARTAEIITRGRSEVILDPDLREIHYGVLQGVKYHEAADVLGAHGLADAWRSGELHRRGTALPGGESLRQFRARSSRFVRKLDQLFLDDGEHDVLVVAHGGKLAVLMTILLALPGRSRYAMRFDNCSLTRVSRWPDRTSLDFFNAIVWDDNWPLMNRETGDRQHPRGE
jgi:broad specificity phosphatase PhoE